MAGGYLSAPLPRGSLQPVGASPGLGGARGPPCTGPWLQGSQDSPPPAPPPRLGSSSGKETDRGEKSARKGCGLAGEPWVGVLAPHSSSRRPGPRSEPSGFLSPGCCPADAQPTEAETAVWNQVNAVLEEAQAVLAELQSYTGAGQEIREVGAAPTPAAHPPMGAPWLGTTPGALLPLPRPSKTPGTCGCRRGPGAPSAPSSPS